MSRIKNIEKVFSDFAAFSVIQSYERDAKKRKYLKKISNRKCCRTGAIACSLFVSEDKHKNGRRNSGPTAVKVKHLRNRGPCESNDYG